MKALLYKEFSLAMHPICYLFVALFPMMILIPSYPISIGFIYVLTCYPILFLGANKGQQSNDLLFSTLLPVRKKDIVFARMITVISMQVAFILIMTALYPVAVMINNNIQSSASGGSQTSTIPGIGLDGYVSILGIALFGYSIADLIFFPIYYKKGRSIVLSTLLTILGFVAYLMMLTVVIPYIPGGEGYLSFLSKQGLGNQFIILGAAILLHIVIHILVYHISSRRLEKVDF